MSDPRMISAEDAQITLDMTNDPGEYRFSLHDTYVRDLAYTVERQAAQIDRVREALHRIEQADEQAQHDWDTKADMLAQGIAMGYSMSAQWLEEALGDADD